MPDSAFDTNPIFSEGKEGDGTATPLRCINRLEADFSQSRTARRERGGERWEEREGGSDSLNLSPRERGEGGE